MRIDLQSKKCQKLHWKVAHKAVCSDNAVVTKKIGESPEERAWAKEIRYWINAWTPAITHCLPLALDLANHEWGRHDTHAYVPSAHASEFASTDSTPTRSLVISTEHTGLRGDHESYRVGRFYLVQHVWVESDSCYCLILLQVKKVTIERVADMIKAMPSIIEVVSDLPGPDMPRLRCVFLFESANPDESIYVRAYGWWMENLREHYFEMDKEYSRMTSMLAIPQLVNEINFLGNPKQAEERFRSMACSDPTRTLIEKVKGDDKKPLA